MLLFLHKFLCSGKSSTKNASRYHERIIVVCDICPRSTEQMRIANLSNEEEFLHLHLLSQDKQANKPWLYINPPRDSGPWPLFYSFTHLHQREWQFKLPITSHPLVESCWFFVWFKNCDKDTSCLDRTLSIPRCYMMQVLLGIPPVQPKKSLVSLTCKQRTRFCHYGIET